MEITALMSDVHASTSANVVWIHVASVTHSTNSLYSLTIISTALSPLPHS